MTQHECLKLMLMSFDRRNLVSLSLNSDKQYLIAQISNKKRPGCGHQNEVKVKSLSNTGVFLFDLPHVILECL